MHVSKARARMESRYCNLVSDIKSSGHQCKLICIEVGSRGIVDKDNQKQIHSLFKLVKENKTKLHCKSLSRLALTGSYVIFWAKNEPLWTDMSLLK